jgi:hypothetical protein
MVMMLGARWLVALVTVVLFTVVRTPAAQAQSIREIGAAGLADASTMPRFPLPRDPSEQERLALALLQMHPGEPLDTVLEQALARAVRSGEDVAGAMERTIGLLLVTGPNGPQVSDPDSTPQAAPYKISSFGGPGMPRPDEEGGREPWRFDHGPRLRFPELRFDMDLFWKQKDMLDKMLDVFWWSDILREFRDTVHPRPEDIDSISPVGPWCQANPPQSMTIRARSDASFPREAPDGVQVAFCSSPMIMVDDAINWSSSKIVVPVYAAGSGTVGFHHGRESLERFLEQVKGFDLEANPDLARRLNGFTGINLCSYTGGNRYTVIDVPGAVKMTVDPDPTEPCTSVAVGWDFRSDTPPLSVKLDGMDVSPLTKAIGTGLFAGQTVMPLEPDRIGPQKLGLRVENQCGHRETSAAFVIKPKLLAFVPSSMTLGARESSKAFKLSRGCVQGGPLSVQLAGGSDFVRVFPAQAEFAAGIAEQAMTIDVLSGANRCQLHSTKLSAVPSDPTYTSPALTVKLDSLADFTLSFQPSTITLKPDGKHVKVIGSISSPDQEVRIAVPGDNSPVHLAFDGQLIGRGDFQFGLDFWIDAGAAVPDPSPRKFTVTAASDCSTKTAVVNVNIEVPKCAPPKDGIFEKVTLIRSVHKDAPQTPAHAMCPTDPTTGIFPDDAYQPGASRERVEFRFKDHNFFTTDIKYYSTTAPESKPAEVNWGGKAVTKTCLGGVVESHVGGDPQGQYSVIVANFKQKKVELLGGGLNLWTNAPDCKMAYGVESQYWQSQDGRFLLIYPYHFVSTPKSVGFAVVDLCEWSIADIGCGDGWFCAHAPTASVVKGKVRVEFSVPGLEPGTIERQTKEVKFHGL